MKGSVLGPEIERLLRAHMAIAKAFETVRVPDSLLKAAYEACRKATPTP